MAGEPDSDGSNLRSTAVGFGKKTADLAVGLQNRQTLMTPTSSLTAAADFLKRRPVVVSLIL